MGYTYFIYLAAFGLSACGAKWTATDSRFYKYQNRDVRVASKITLTEKRKPNVGGRDGTEFGLRLYSGNYGALLKETELTVGSGLEASGTTNVPEVVTIEISEFRLGGTPNSYPDFCAEVRMKDSNLPDWTRLGCVHFTDTPSESPTGGLSLIEASLGDAT